MSEDLEARLRAVKLFLCDVDGVLTDASVFMGGGQEFKRFDIRDGLGLRLLQQSGIKVGWVSARPSAATTERANDLKIDFLHQSPAPKVEAIAELLEKAGVTWAETSYMGDDVVDLGALRRTGFAAVPADAIPEARALAHYVTHAAGGHGAVREVVELVLRAQGRWGPLVTKFAS
jgi:3-deoxy-D-manno-octulosonate 8-phosphate phosphatase (KDO 8-P phosphatase)